ncbi:MAG: NADH-quinone oxidoreductase subunit J [Desulfurococcales archaeon]|nr:NADH-quinone oxidoreductase subunit J [Desulfurococcales archaeon]MCE4605571.1 NADH-quinone oxidoreductase subunit J [Desulfurococcales archaeon]
MIDIYKPLIAGILAAFMVLTSYLVVRSRDLVYASGSLAVLGVLNAALLALLGYGIVAVFLVVVYVGAAVMFIIVAVSMLGGGGPERWQPEKGAFAAASALAVLLIVVLASSLYTAYTQPESISLKSVSGILVGKYLPVLGVIFVALAATLIEAIAIARKR